MKYILAFVITLISSPVLSKDLVSYISTEYKIPPSVAASIVTAANKHSYKHTFPTSLDILAIIAIESNFKQYATNKNAKGLMQVLYKPTSYNIDRNVEDGSNLLKTYKKWLKPDEIVMSYNIGLGAYLDGHRNYHYLTKFKTAKRKLKERND